MNFAKNLLGKYGWKEGDGLGKEKQGIKRPIKANLKFDKAGLGDDPSREFSNNWWERAFNDAAKSVEVKKQDNGDISVDLKDSQTSVEVTTKGYSVKKLTESGTMYSKSFVAEDVAFSSFAVTECKALTDDELFRACGGRTAHKGARHGLKLSGKLARLEKQEKELLAKMQARIKESESKPSKKSGDSFTQVFNEVLNDKNPVDEASNNVQKRSKRKHKNLKDECSAEKITKSDATSNELTQGPAIENRLSEDELDTKLSKSKKHQNVEGSQNSLIQNDEPHVFKSKKSKKNKKKKRQDKNE